jgi:hypothetical protein
LTAPCAAAASPASRSRWRPASCSRTRDYPVLNDYRAVLGGIFAWLYGLSQAQIQQVFPGGATKDIGLG